VVTYTFLAAAVTI